MVKNSKQSWEIGQKVNVGFLKNLTVIEKIPTPGDFAPDAYVLQSNKGVKYEFVPHKGLYKIN